MASRREGVERAADYRPFALTGAAVTANICSCTMPVVMSSCSDSSPLSARRIKRSTSVLRTDLDHGASFARGRINIQDFGKRRDSRKPSRSCASITPTPSTMLRRIAPERSRSLPSERMVRSMPRGAGVHASAQARSIRRADRRAAAGRKFPYADAAWKIPRAVRRASAAASENASKRDAQEDRGRGNDEESKRNRDESELASAAARAARWKGSSARRSTTRHKRTSRARYVSVSFEKSLARTGFKKVAGAANCFHIDRDAAGRLRLFRAGAARRHPRSAA